MAVIPTLLARIQVYM